MTFDPDKFIAEYDAQPAAEGVPPMLARPNAGNVPDYTADPPPAAHDEVKPGQAKAVRAEIAKVTSAPGFHEMPPAEQQSAIIEAVHAITRAAGAAVPFGHVTGAALASAPLIGNGHTYRENLDAMDQQAAQSAAAHPIASMIGTTAGLGATVAASGGFGSLGLAPGATAPAAGPSLARLVAPVGENAAIGGAQGAGETAARGGDAGDVLREGVNGAVSGATVGAAIPAAGALLGKTLTGAVNRSDRRMLSEIGDGAQAPKRRALNERGDDVVDLVRKTPSLEKTWKNPREFTAAAKTELGVRGRELDSIYEAADKGGKIDAGAAAGALKAVQSRLGSDLSTEEVSTALQPTIAKLDRRAETMQPIGSSELRREVTRLQDIAYHKGPGAEPSNVQQAAAEAAKVLKDVLEKHVETNLPGQMDRVRELNKDQTILARIKGASEFKAVNGPNENASRLTKSLQNNTTKILHGGGVAGIAYGAANGKNLPEIAGGLALAAAPHVIPPVARAADEALASMGRAAGQVRTEAVAPLTQRLTMAKNPGQVKNELMSHIFGGNSSREDIPEPEAFGPAATTSDEPESLVPK